MVTLFACPGSGNCLKPWLVMTQLGKKFKLKLVNVLEGEQKEPEFLRHNPLGVVPYLKTDTGFGLGESNAMLWYLAEGTHLMPDSAAERAEALQWMFFEQSKLEPFLSPARFFSVVVPEQRAAKAKDIAQWQDGAKSGLSRLNAHLETRQFMLSSGYSIADIAVFGYVHLLDEAGLDPADYPMITSWINDVTQTEKFAPLQNMGQGGTLAA